MTKTEVNIKPLEHEFWPLEGVFFNNNASFSDETVTVICRIHGDLRYKHHVALRFLNGFDVDVKSMDDSASLYALSLSGHIEAINNSFYGFGIVFNKDFDPDGRLVVDVEGQQKYSFLINLE